MMAAVSCYGVDVVVREERMTITQGWNNVDGAVT